MPVPSYITVGEIAATFGVPAWKARRAVDALGAEIPRAGRYRLVPRELLGRVAVEIEKLRTTASSRGKKP